MSDSTGVRKLNLNVTDGKTYNLDALASEEGSRMDTSIPLAIHIHRYNPQSLEVSRRSPIPAEVKIGQIWIPRIDPLL